MSEENKATTPVESTNVPPAAPAPVQPPTSGAPVNPKSKQNLIIGGIIAAAVIVGLVYFMSAGKVSKEDYRQAVETGNSITSKASASVSDVTRISYISSYTTETQLKNNLDDAEKSLKEYQEANKELDDVKALKDKDVKAKYDEYKKKYDAYVSFASDYIASAKVVLPAVVECEDVSSSNVSDVAAFKAAIAPCVDALDDASDVKNKDLSDFSKTYKESIDKMSSLVDEAAALPANDYTKRSAIRTQIYDLSSDISKAQRDANSNITKKLKEVNPRDTFNAFGNLLEDKQRN